MTRTTKEVLLISTGTVVLLAIVWLLPEYWLKGLLSAGFISNVWIMYRMDK